jgi:outer membrane protein TolC
LNKHSSNIGFLSIFGDSFQKTGIFAVNITFLMKFINYMALTLKRVILIITGILITSFEAFSQNNNNAADTVPYLTLDQCIAYSLKHQPSLMQSEINIAISQKTNAIYLAGWLPQVYLSGTITHYFELPTALEENTINPEGPPIPTKAGVYNTATPELSATETVFSPGLLYAAKSAHLLVQQAMQSRDSASINLIVTVSKAFYNLLLNLEQIKIYKEDTARDAKNLKDTYHQYLGGIVDKTDYKEATITLNNDKALLRQAVENVIPLYASLKLMMGFPPEKEFNVSFDLDKMMTEVTIDTSQPLKYENRIEYQLLETSKKIQEQNINYYRYNFLPTLSAFYTYNYEYENNTFSNLFTTAYPYSFIGGSVSIPLFTGLARIESVQRAKLQGQQIDWSMVNLKSGIYSQYTTALATYKSNLYNLILLKENVTMAIDVYNIVTLQYKQGVVAYLNVITAQSNLVSSQIGYLNALFQVLSSKVDFQKAMGAIPPSH